METAKWVPKISFFVDMVWLDTDYIYLHLVVKKEQVPRKKYVGAIFSGVP